MKFFNIHLSKSFIDLTKGHVISQIIGAISSIFIAELYGASALGVFSVFFTTTTIVSTLNTVRLESVLFLDQEAKEQQNNSVGLLWVMLLSTFIFIIISLFIPVNYIEKYFVNRALLLFIIIGALFNSVRTMFYNLELLHNNFKRIKYSKILFTVAKYCAQFGVVIFTTNYLGLVFGYFLGVLLVIIYLKKNITFWVKDFSLLMFKNTIKRHAGLLKYALPGDIVNTIAINVFPVLLKASYGDTLTGNYFMSYLFLSIPLAFLHSVISPVFFKKSVKLANEFAYQELLTYTFRIVKRIFVVMSLPLLIVLFVGNEIVVFFLNEEWRNTGVFLQIFSILFIARILYSPISSLEEVLKKNHISLLVNIYFVIVLFLGIFAGRETYSIFEIASFISVFTALGYLFLLFYFYINLCRLVKSVS